MDKDKKQIPELAYLLEKVEERYGRRVNTSTDFEALSVTIERETGEFISASTLKRLWGYVTLQPSPRVATLDVLARYAGAPSFSAFCKGLKTDPSFESGFFTTRFIVSDELSEGDTVTVGWAPNRLVKLLYLGGSSYRVVSSENSKLRIGDEFSASQFMLGYPLFVDRILREGEYTPSYVAGKIDGLNCLKIN